MKTASEDLNKVVIDSRPSTGGSLFMAEGSHTSLRSLFTKRKIYPVVADVVYGTGDPSEKNTRRSVPKPIVEEIVDEEVENKSGFQRLLSKLKDAWVSKSQYDIKKDPDMFIKSTLRQLFTYLIFLVLLMIIIFCMYSTDAYYFNDALTKNIIKYKFADGSGTFRTIGSIDDLWKYLEQPLMQSLYWDTWYNLNKNQTVAKKGRIYFDDKLVGSPRLRLLKVKPNTCRVASTFQTKIMACYDSYSDGASETTSFGPANDTAWIYSKNDTSFTYNSQLGSYPRGGYIQVLPHDRDSAVAVIGYLKSNRWLDRTSRVVFIDYSYYNPNVELFGVVKLIIEFPPTGGAQASLSTRAIKLVRYVKSTDYFVLCCEVLFFIFILYYIIEEIMEIRKHGIRYFVALWNVIDVFVLIISLSCGLLSVYRCIIANSQLNSLLVDKNEYANFDFATYWQQIYNEAICVNIFLCWIKIFKYISFNKTMSQLTDTLARSVDDLIGFVVLFFIFFLAFAQLSYLLFNNQISDYRSFEVAVFSLFRIMLGDFAFYDLYKANSFLGPLFFILFIFFVFFVLMNMFVAIICDSFMAVKQEIDKFKDTFHIAQFFQRQIWSRLKKDKITKIQEVLEKGAIMNAEELSFQDWRTELLQYGYADVEIQALFLKYDQDGDRVLDYDERNKMLKDIKDKKLHTLEFDSTEEDDAEATNKDNNEFVTEEQMRELTHRIDNVETGLFGIISKIDRVLEFLADSEKAKLSHQKNVRLSLNILTGSRTNLQM